MPCHPGRSYQEQGGGEGGGGGREREGANLLLVYDILGKVSGSPHPVLKSNNHYHMCFVELSCKISPKLFPGKYWCVRVFDRVFDTEVLARMAPLFDTEILAGKET